MSDFDDYESLPDNVPLSVTMSAGAAAGISEHCFMFPVDSVKTRMQSLDCEKQSLNGGIRRTLTAMITEEGLLRPMRGVSAMGMGAGPAHALYFSCYEHTKRVMTAAFNGNEVWGQGIAGAAATFCHDSIMTPAEVIKQRMQMCCSPFKSVFSAAKTIYVNEGYRAFYRSFGTSLSMNVPYHVTHFWTYEFMMKFLNPDGVYNPSIHFISGASAGAVASAMTMPLDVCKTLLNTQEPSVLRKTGSANIIGMSRAIRIIYDLKGLPGFFRGLQARVVYQMPATAISWSVYEFFKQYLKSRDHSHEKYDTLSESNRGDTFKIQSSNGDWSALMPNVFSHNNLVLAEDIKSD